jgi:hypothetical protein
MKAKELIDALKDRAEKAAADAGEKAGKVFRVSLSFIHEPFFFFYE